MNINKREATGLPAPRWCFIVLAVPTFYMPLSYIIIVIWALVKILSGRSFDSPGWMESSLYVTYVMLPVYLLWAGFSKMLIWREKIYWLFIIIFLNMLGMPVFYVFMIRRYLGLEGRTGKQDEIALDSFLTTCGLERNSFSTHQLYILKSYCRRQRFTIYGSYLMILMSCLMFYMAFVFVPQNCIKIFSGNIPTRVVIIDSTKNAKEEIVPDPEAEVLYIKNIMMMGAMAGMFGAMGLFVLIQAIPIGWANWHRKAFIEYLKAKEDTNH